MLFNPYLEIILRSVAVYLFIVFAIRLFGKKELSQLSVIDLVFILLISNSVQNAMVGNNTTLEGGIIAALSLFTLNFIFKKILFKSRKISEFLQGKPVLLVYEGKIQQHNLDQVDITLEELEAAIREHGFDNEKEINIAMLEVDGNISVTSAKSGIKTIYPIKTKRKLKGKFFKH